MSSPNPYEPPPLPEPEAETSPARAAATDDEYEGPPFRSPQWMGVVCILLLGLIIMHTGADVYAAAQLYFLQGESIPEDELNTDAIAVWTFCQSIFAITSWPMSIISHLWLIAWMYRCHRNLEPLGHSELDSKHIWAVLCWFFPVLNLFCPYQVMREIWWRSYPLAKDSADSAPASHLIFWWWLLRVAAVVTAYLAQWFVYYETWPQYYTYLRTFLLSCGCDIVSALLAIIIVHRISRWQLARYQSLQESVAQTA